MAEWRFCDCPAVAQMCVQVRKKWRHQTATRNASTTLTFEELSQDKCVQPRSQDWASALRASFWAYARHPQPKRKRLISKENSSLLLATLATPGCGAMPPCMCTVPLRDKANQRSACGLAPIRVRYPQMNSMAIHVNKCLGVLMAALACG